MKYENKGVENSSIYEGDIRMESPPIGSKMGSTANQSQPLQARSSNSGTSFKKSDISQSSCQGTGEVCSDMAGNWIKSNTLTQQPVHGHLTSAFTQITPPSNPGQEPLSKNQMAPRRMTRQQAANLTRGSTATNSTRVRSNSSNQIDRQPKSNKKDLMAESFSNQVSEMSSNSAGASRSGSMKSASQKTQNVQKETGKNLSGSVLSQGQSRINENQKTMGGSQQSGKSVDGGSQGLESGENVPQMRQTRSRSKQLAVTVSDVDPSPNKMSPLEKSESLIVGDAIGNQSNGQSQKDAMMVDQQSDVRKFEMNQPVSLNLRVCEQTEECKIVGDGDVSTKRVSPASQAGSIVGNQKEKGSISYGISDSGDSLVINPLCTLIKEFQNQRHNAQLTDQFEKEMLYLEESYQQQQVARQEQMKLFEQTYGMARTTRNADPKNVVAPVKPTYGSSTFARTPIAENGATADIVDNFANDASLSLGQHDISLLNPINEEGSMMESQQSSFNPQLSSHLGAPASEISVGEVYESYHFMQNSLISFYPKDVRRCFQRRKAMNANQLSTDKILNSLKPPKHANKARKVASKMQNLAHCQMNMMQVLLQKISRKSKVIRKQEKIVNDNLKRKRIYLENEKFDIMSVLKHSIRANEKSQNGQLSKKRQSSPTNSKCMSTAANQSAFGVNLPSIRGCADDFSTDEQQLRKSGKQFQNLENTLSTTFANEKSSQRTSGLRQDYSKINQNQHEKILQTPEKSQKAYNEEKNYIRAEQQVHQALHLSEIEDSFFKGSNRYSIKPEESSLSGTQETHKQKRRLHFSHQNNVEHDLNGDNLVEQTMTPDTVQAMMDARLESDTPQYGYEHEKFQNTAAPCPSQSLDQDPATNNKVQQLRKNNSTQAKKKRKSALKNQNNLALNGQSPTNTLLARFNDSQGTYAIADLQKNRAQNQNSELTFKIRLQDQEEARENIRHNDRFNTSKAQKSAKSSLQKGEMPSVQIPPVMTSDKNEMFEDDESKLSSLRNVQQNQESAADSMPHPQLQYSQSVHIPHHQVVIDQPFFAMQQMHENIQMEEYVQSSLVRAQANQQPYLQHPQMFDNLALQRSQSMMVPQPQYDMFFEESPVDLSIEAQAAPVQYVANPYEAAKKAYYESQRKNQGDQEKHLQFAKQSASEANSYQDVNTHNLPQVQDVNAPQEQNHYVSPMHLGQLSQNQTPLNKLQENMTMVEHPSTPSRFMSGVEQNGHHLAIPYMNRMHMVHPSQMYQNQLLLSNPGFCEMENNQNQQNPHHNPHGVHNSAMSGASVLYRGNQYTPAALLSCQPGMNETNINAWQLDDNDTQSGQMVDSMLINSAPTISESQNRQHSSSQQRSAEGEVELLKQDYHQQHRFI